MPFVETRLISPTTLTTSASSALYTVPTGYSAIIKQLVVTNITGTAATFTFYIGAASAGNALFSGTSVAANDTVIINLSQVLTTGEVLRALASVGSALNLTVSGVLNDGPLASTATYIADNAITSAKIADGAIVNADINASAAIAVSKLAPSSSSGQVLMGGPSGAPTYTTASGDVTIDQSGVTAIGTGVIVNADINASAAIDQTKVSGLGTAWLTWVPVVTQGATISIVGSYLAKYKQIGKTVFVQLRFGTTSAGTAANPLLISLPIAPINNGGIGSISISGSGTNTYVNGMAIWWSSGAGNQFGQLSASGNWWGSNPSTALASGEAVYASLVYEVA